MLLADIVTIQHDIKNTAKKSQLPTNTDVMTGTLAKKVRRIVFTTTMPLGPPGLFGLRFIFHFGLTYM